MSMKKLFLIVSVVFLWVSCDDPQPNDLLPHREVDVSVDLNLPMYQNLLLPGGYAFTPTTSEYGFKGIFIYNRNGRYVAFDRACPHLAVNACAAMTFDGLYLICTCDGTKFNPINGGTSSTVEFQAREYHVTVYGNVLKINNY